MATSTHLLVTDQQQTVVRRGGDRQVFSPFGFGARHALGFNGERVDGLTERYLLGHGYRAFSPVLMRFVSPDSWSPFGEGGLNAYAYCLGDPVNARDPTGHLPKWLLRLLRRNVSKSTSSPHGISASMPNLAQTPIGQRTGGAVGHSPKFEVPAQVQNVRHLSPVATQRGGGTTLREGSISPPYTPDDIAGVSTVTTTNVYLENGDVYSYRTVQSQSKSGSGTYVNEKGEHLYKSGRLNPNEYSYNADYQYRVTYKNADLRAPSSPLPPRTGELSASRQ